MTNGSHASTWGNSTASGSGLVAELRLTHLQHKDYQMASPSISKRASSQDALNPHEEYTQLLSQLQILSERHRQLRGKFRCVEESSLNAAALAFEAGRLLLEGLSDAEIATRLKISKSSAKKHINRLFREFRIPRRGIQRIVLAVKLSQYPIFSE